MVTDVTNLLKGNDSTHEAKNKIDQNSDWNSQMKNNINQAIGFWADRDAFSPLINLLFSYCQRYKDRFISQG